MASSFGKRLRSLASAASLSAADLAAAAGLPRASAELWLSPEGNARADTTLGNALALCRVFSCSLSYLAGTSDVFGACPPPCDPRSFVSRLPVLLNRFGKTLHGMLRNTSVTDTHLRVWKSGGPVLLSDIVSVAEFLSCTLDELL